MSIVDLLVTIIIVTILVTIVLAVVTYIAYKLRLARRPAVTDAPAASRYFDVHEPAPAAEPAGPDAPTWVLDREPEEEGAEKVGAPVGSAAGSAPDDPEELDSREHAELDSAARTG